MIKLLIGGPVRQKPQILEEFLKGLDETDKKGIETTYFFVDDNIVDESSELLQKFSVNHDVILKKGDELFELADAGNYSCNEITHIWDQSSINKIAFYKDTIIDYTIAHNYDYLFLIDSDIILDHRALLHLISRDVEIVSNVFWTQWKPNWNLDAQCFWIPGLSEQSKVPFSRAMHIDAARQIQKNFFAMLRIPGIYRVDGLGACTLIKRSALEKGVRFKEVPNLSMLGEDRHFCIRAGVLGIDLFIDTVYPAYHVYREEYINRISEFKRDGFKFDMCQTFESKESVSAPKYDRFIRATKSQTKYLQAKLKEHLKPSEKKALRFDKSNEKNTLVVLSVINEQTLLNYSHTLDSISNVANAIVVMDLTSSARVKDITREYFSADHCKIIRPKVKNDINYSMIRKVLWIQAKNENPTWILALDSGEVLPESLSTSLPYLMDNHDLDAYFFRIKSTNDIFINEDFLPCLMRYNEEYDFQWKLADAKNNKLPDEVYELSYAEIDMDSSNSE